MPILLSGSRVGAVPVVEPGEPLVRLVPSCGDRYRTLLTGAPVALGGSTGEGRAA